MSDEENPLFLVGKVVDVETTKEKHCKVGTVRGLLWNADPESGNAILVTKRADSDRPLLSVITSHGIVRMAAAAGVAPEVREWLEKAGASLSSAVSGSLTRSATEYSLEDVSAKLSAARLPFEVSETGTVSILSGAAEIAKPYGQSTIKSANDQVLAKLLRLFTP
ncbi:hypothetical protein DIPPA_31798 [Diplonema papillatum]|nr:hypothetical protein DIPPA_31798 [Diplonema papillatum]